MNDYKIWKVLGYVAIGLSVGASVLMTVATNKTTAMDNKKEIEKQVKLLSNSHN